MKGEILNLFGRLVCAVFLAVVFAGTGFAQCGGFLNPCPPVNTGGDSSTTTMVDNSGGGQANEAINLANYISTSFNLRAEAGSEQIIVRWDRPDDFAGLVTRYDYTVHWRERRQGRSGADNATTVTASVINQDEELSYTISNGLTNARRYDVWVTARSDTRLGLMSPTVAAVPVFYPDDPYAEDPLELVPFLHSQKTFPTFDDELIGVYLCDVGLGSALDMDAVIARLEVTVPYFEWLSGGAYTPVFVPGGRVEGAPATPSDSPLSRVNIGGCPIAVREELRTLAEGGETRAFNAVMIVALADDDPQTDRSYELQQGFASFVNLLNESHYPGNLREIYVTTEVLNGAPQILAHEMGHSLKWRHSYSEEEGFASFLDEYDNPMDIISGTLDQTDARLFAGTLAINRYSVGWIAPDKVTSYDLSSGASASYMLRAAGADPGAGEYEMLVIPGNSKGHYYTLGARFAGATGYDSQLPKFGVEMYQVRFAEHEEEIALTLPAASAIVNQVSGEGNNTAHVFGVGESYTLDSKKVRIDVTSGSNGVYSVEVTPVEGVPSAPKDVVVARTTGQVTLSWTPPDRDGGSAITGYEAHLRYYDDPRREYVNIASQTLASDAREHMFDLSALQEYQDDYLQFITRIYGAPEVWVTAVNANGEGVESRHRSGLLLFDLPRLVIISYRFIGPNSVRVGWDRVDSGPNLFGEYLSGITVRWTPLPGTEGQAGSQTEMLGTGSPYDTSHSTRMTILPQGALNYEYRAEFTRYFDGGTDTLPQVFRFRIPAPPRNPALSPGNKAITVNWAPPANTYGLSIPNYVVYWRVADSGADPSSATATGIQHTISGLQNDTEYEVWVAADSALGQSDESGRLRATTTNVPNPPFNVRAASGDAEISVSWEISQDQVEIVTGYTVHWQERLPGRGGNNSGDVMTAQVSLDTNRTYVITGLTNDAYYDVWVTALGAAENSEPSDKTQATPVSGPDNYRTEDTHELITFFNIQKTFPTFSGERIGVYLCDVGLDSTHTMTTAINRLTEIAEPYFNWLSGGAYTPVFVPGGEVRGTAATPSDSPLSAVNIGECPIAVRERLRNPAEGENPDTFNAVMIVALADNDPQTNGSYELQEGFAAVASLLREPHYPGNLREIYITTQALNSRPQVLVHEMGHSLKWPHSYSDDGRFLFSQEYDNPMDMMSGANDQGMNINSFPGTVAINRYSVGWIAPDKVAIHDLSGGSTSYTLKAAGVDPEEDEYEMLVIPGYSKGHYYTLGARSADTAVTNIAETNYDSDIPKSGVEMYEVEFVVAERQLALVPPDTRPRIRQISEQSETTAHVFADGEGYTLEGKKVRIEVTDGIGGVYTVMVTPEPGVPSPPRNTTVARTQEAITLQWEPPADNGDSSITAYNVHLRYYNDELARNVTHVATVSAATTEHTFNLREMFPEYEMDYIKFVARVYAGIPRVWVTAVNANGGESAHSTRRNAELFHDLEQLVTTSYQFTGSDSVRVEWYEIAIGIFAEYLSRITMHWRHLDTGEVFSQSLMLGTGSPYDTSHSTIMEITTEEDPSEYEYYTSFTRYYDGVVYTSPPVRVVSENDFSRNRLAYNQPAGTYTGIQFAHESLTVNLAGVSANLFQMRSDGRVVTAVPFTRQGILALPPFPEKSALLDQELASFPVEVKVRAGVSVLPGISIDLALFHPLVGDDITFVTCAPFGQEVLAIPETFPPGDHLGCLAFNDGSSQYRLLADSIRLSGDSLFSLILLDEGSALQSAALTLNRLLDYEVTTTHRFTIEVFLNGQDTVRKDFEIQVSDVDEPLPPLMLVDVNSAPNVVADNANTGAGTGLRVSLVGFEDDAVSYMITNTDGGDSTFQIDGRGNVMAVQTQPVANDDEHTVQITATEGGRSIARNFPVLVISTVNTDFRIISGDSRPIISFSVDEGVYTGILIVDLDVAGGDSGDTVMYTLSVVPEQPSGGNGFTINNNGEVRLTGNLDFETAGGYNLDVRATGNPSGDAAQRFIVVQVQDVPEPPTAAFNVEIGASYANGRCVLAPTGVFNTPVNHAVLLNAGASNDSDSGDALLTYSWHVVPLQIVQQPAPPQGNDALYCFTPTPGVSDYTITLDVREFGTAFLTSTTTEVTLPSVFVPPVPPVLRAVITDVEDRRLIPFQELTLDGSDSNSEGNVTGYAWSVSPAGDGDLLSSPMNLPTVTFTAPESGAVVSGPGEPELRERTTYTVTLEVEDAASETTSTEVELTVLPVRIQSIGSEGTGTTAFSVLESSAPNQGFGFQVQAQRVDDEASTSLSSLGYTVRYSLLPANVPFAINEADGVVRLTEPLNFTGDNAPTWNVIALARMEPRSEVGFLGSTLQQTFTLTGVSDRLAVGLTDSDSANDEVPDGLQNTPVSGVSLVVVVDGGSVSLPNNTVTFSLSSNPGNRFAIDSQTGAISLASASNPGSYQVTVNVAVQTQGGETGSATLALTIEVLAVAMLELQDTDANSNEVQEIIPGAPVTGVDLSLQRDEATPTNIVYSLTANLNGLLFAIDSQTGVITAAGSLDYETGATREITVTAQGQLDGGTMQASLALTIDVEDLWEFMIASGQGQDPYVTEGMEGAEVMNTIPTMLQGLTCANGFRYLSWSGNNPGYTSGGGDPSGRFELAQGGTNPSIRLKSGISLDFETEQGPHVVYINFRGNTCSGLGTGTVSSSNRDIYPPLLIFVRNVNEGPGEITDIDARSDRIAHTSQSGVEVGIRAQAVDPEGDVVTYSLTNNADGKFRINTDSGVISSLDLGVQPSQDTQYIVTVEAMSSAEGGTVFPTRDFTITVLVDEPYPTAVDTVRAESGSAAEGEMAAFEIGLNMPVPGGDTATITYRITPGTASPLSVDDDLDASTTQTTIAAAGTQASVSVAVRHDSRIEDPEGGIFTVQRVSFATNPGMGFTPIEDSTASFTITDATTMSVNVSVGDAAEGFAGQAGMIPVTVRVANEADLFLDRNVVVGLSFSGSAKPNTDYVPLIPASVTFRDAGPSQSKAEHDVPGNGLSEMATVTLIPDTMENGFRTLTVSIDSNQQDRAVEGGTSAGRSGSATATINDNDLRVSVAAQTEQINEGGDLIFIVTLAGTAPHPDLAIGYEISGIDANDVRPEDAGKLTTGTVVIAAGSSSATLMLTTLMDGVVESTETATITLTTLPAGLLLDSDSSSADVVVINTDRGPATVVDVDDGVNSVAENRSTNTAVGIAVVARHDGMDLENAAFILTSDNFQIGTTGVVTTKRPLDYETTATHTITVTAVPEEEGVSSAQATFTIAVTNEADRPLGEIMDADGFGNRVNENAGNAEVGITAQAVDPDNGDGFPDPVRYRLSDDAGGRFVIDAMTGVVRTAAVGLDAEDPELNGGSSWRITVEAESDFPPDTTSGSFTVTVDSVNEQPTVVIMSDAREADGVFHAIEPNSVLPPIQLRSQVTDPDDGDTHTYAWIAEPSESVTFGSPTNSSTTFAATRAGDYQITLTVTDNGGSGLTASMMVTIRVTPGFGARREFPREADTSRGGVMVLLGRALRLGESMLVTYVLITTNGATLDDINQKSTGTQTATATSGSNNILIPVTAVDDEFDDDGETVEVQITRVVFTSDAGIQSDILPVTHTLELPIIDNDELVVRVMPPQVAMEQGSTASVNAAMSPLTSEQSVTLGLTAPPGGGLALSATSLVFSQSVTMQDVVISAGDLATLGAQRIDVAVDSVNNAMVRLPEPITATVIPTAIKLIRDVAVAAPAEASTAGGVTLTLTRALKAGESVSVAYTLTAVERATAADLAGVDNFPHMGTLTLSALGENNTIRIPVIAADDAFDDDNEIVSVSIDRVAFGDMDGMTRNLLLTNLTPNPTPLTISDNDGPVTVEDDDDNDNSVLENADIGTAVGIAVVARQNNEDLTGATFALDSEDFQIGTTGVVTTKRLLNHEFATTHTITVTANLNNGTTAQGTFIIEVRDQPEPPMVSLAAQDMPGESVTIVVGQAITLTVEVRPMDTQVPLDFTYEYDWDVTPNDDSPGLENIATTAPMNIFSIDNLSVSRAYTITVTATETNNRGTGAGETFLSGSAQISVQVNSTQVNLVDRGNGNGSYSIDEGLPGMLITTMQLVETAEDEPTALTDVSYMLDSVPTSMLFEISNANGIGSVTVTGALDYEMTTSYTLMITARETNRNLTGELELTVNVNNLNDTTPTIIGITNVSLETGAATGTEAGRFTVSDGDNTLERPSTFTIMLGGGDTSLFEVTTPTGNTETEFVIELAEVLARAPGNLTLTVTADDGANTDEETFTVTVANLPPTASIATIPATSGLLTGQVITLDASGSTDTHTGGGIAEYEWQVFAGEDRADGLLSTTNTATTEFTAPLDLIATQTEYVLELTVTDNNDAISSATTALTVYTVDLVNTADSNNTALTGSVNEDAGTGTDTGLAVAVQRSDGYRLAVDSWSLPDGAPFAIDSSGVVTVAGELNYETGPAYMFNVTAMLSTALIFASDDAKLRSERITVMINNVDEGPGMIIDSDTRADRIDYISQSGDEVGIRARAVDPEGDAVTYSLANNADGRFQINPASGIITSLNLGTRPAQDTPYIVTVEAMSSAEDGPATQTRDFTITVLVEPYPTAVDTVRAESGSAAEGEMAAFEIGLNMPVPGGDTATIIYRITPGTASPLSVDDDLDASTTQTTIAAAGTQTSVSVAVRHDSRIEDPEGGIFTVQRVSFAANPGMGFTPTEDSTASFTITDATMMSVNVSVGDAAEGFAGAAGMIPVTVSVANEADLFLDRDVVVGLSFGGAAVANSDYMPLNPASVTFQDTGAGQSAPEHYVTGGAELSETAMVALIPDTLEEGNETFIVSIAATQTDPAVVRAAADYTKTATISDNNLRASVAAQTGQINEGGDLIFIVTLAGTASHPDLAIGYEISGIDADDLRPGDADKLTTGTVMIAAGSNNTTLMLETRIDEVEDTETAMITLTALPAGLLLDSDSSSAVVRVENVLRESETARYQITFQSNWSREAFPTNFPSGSHFSPFIGGTHNDEVVFWEPGTPATPGIENMAEFGGTSTLRSEVEAAISDGAADQVLGPFNNISDRNPHVLGTYTVSRNYPLVTLTSMVAPSPDWFVGVHGHSLLNGAWVTAATVNLRVYDAGTEMVRSNTNPFSLNNDAENPHLNISLLTTDAAVTDFEDGVHRDDGTYIATLTFTRISAVRAESSSAAEGEMAAFEIGLNTPVPDGDTATISYRITPGTASPLSVDDDLDVSTTQTTIAAAGMQASVSVAVRHDSRIEGAESGIFTVQRVAFARNPGLDFTLAEGNAASFTITDATTMSVNVSAGNAAEGFAGAAGMIPVTVSVANEADLFLDRDVVVGLSFGGAAVANSDYMPLNPASVTFQDTGAGQTPEHNVTGGAELSETAMVALIPDTLEEGNETFIVSIAATQTDPAVVRAAADYTTTAMIRDNDLRASVAAETGEINEGGDLIFIVTLAGTAPHPDLAIGYEIAGIDTNDVEPADAAKLTGDVSLGAGATSTELRLATRIDEVEDTETATITLTALPAGLLLDSDSSSAVVRVENVLRESETARYQITFQSNWSREAFPTNFPFGSHFSPFIGGTHNDEVVFWESGTPATPGIENMAEFGGTFTLRSEVEAAISDGAADQVLEYPNNIFDRNPHVLGTYTVSRNYPLVTMTSMVAPSPDWFVGVHGHSLLLNGAWVTATTVNLRVYDAGTEMVRSNTNPFSLNNDAENPHLNISLLTTDAAVTDFENGVHRDDGTYIATLAFTRIRDEDDRPRGIRVRIRVFLEGPLR